MRYSEKIDCNYNLCIAIANAFLEIGKESNEYDRVAQSSDILFHDDAFYALPAIVNTALSCELYLKAEILASPSCSNVPQEHFLMDLFRKLPNEKRNVLCQEYIRRRKNQSELEETFLIHSDSFRKWRYAFEKDNTFIEAYPDNLILAAEVLRDDLENRERML